jgi:hypothetical protein
MHEYRYDLKKEPYLAILGNLPDKSLKGQLPYEQLGPLLILAYLTARVHARKPFIIL